MGMYGKCVLEKTKKWDMGNLALKGKRLEGLDVGEPWYLVCEGL